MPSFKSRLAAHSDFSGWTASLPNRPAIPRVALLIAGGLGVLVGALWRDFAGLIACCGCCSSTVVAPALLIALRKVWHSSRIGRFRNAIALQQHRILAVFDPSEVTIDSDQTLFVSGRRLAKLKTNSLMLLGSAKEHFVPVQNAGGSETGYRDSPRTEPREQDLTPTPTSEYVTVLLRGAIGAALWGIPVSQADLTWGIVFGVLGGIGAALIRPEREAPPQVSLRTDDDTISLEHDGQTRFRIHIADVTAIISMNHLVIVHLRDQTKVALTRHAAVLDEVLNHPRLFENAIIKNLSAAHTA